VITPPVSGDLFDWLGPTLHRVLHENPVQIPMALLRAWEAVDRLSDRVGYHRMGDIVNHDALISPWGGLCCRPRASLDEDYYVGRAFLRALGRTRGAIET
jgi:hypothetical protein